MSKATHQRSKLSSAESKFDLMSILQQLMMNAIRKKRTTKMNLIEKKNEKSKMYNHIMTTLKKSNKTKKDESYKFRKMTNFSIERKSQKRSLSNENEFIIHD